MSSSYKVEMGVELFKKYVTSSMIVCYRSVVRHPFLVVMVFILIWMHRMFPVFFSFLVSSSPVIVSTAVLLGTLLSYGQPNIPEIEKETESEQHEIRKLESKVMSQTEIVGRDGNFASEETNGSRIEVGDKSFEVENPVNHDDTCVEVNKPLYLVDDGEFVTEGNCGNSQFGEEHLVDEAKNEIDEVKVVLGSHYTPLKQSEDDHVVLESDDKLWEGSADPLNSDPALLWKRVEGDGYDEDEDDDDDESDSGSDLAESSSPDASMADIIPMLDELHPLLSEEQEIHREHNNEDGIIYREDSEHSLESSESSSESNDEDGDENHKDEEVGEEEDEEEEDKESKHTDREDEPRSVITWTEDDQKNLMNLGTSEMERNRRLELIARRRARKTSEFSDEDGDENHKDEEVGDEEDEDKESKHTDKEDEPRSAITWTEDDQKNLMNLGTSEMERNRRLELIARRRARKTSEFSDEDGDENHKDEEVGDEEDEDKESKHTDKEDEPRSAITWTEDDQKNLMNLGTSEMERNRRLENLIARRRARKTMRMQAEKNLIDLESADLPWNIPPISTARSNPFDYDANDNIPGSAPSVLLKRRNPFDLPYDSSEEKPDLVGDTFQQEFAGFQPKEPYFRRHESFNVGPSNFGALRSERQETKLRPYFVPERALQRQFSGISDSKASSVPDTESVSSAGDLENKDHEDEQSLEPELVSEKDQEHEHPELISESHERPYFVPEHVSSVAYERQLSEVSDSKLSSIPDTESVSSAGDLENKDHIEDDRSLEPELVSERDQEHEELISDSHERPYFIPEHVGSVAFERQSSELSNSKLSSISDTESVSSADDLENEDHIDLSQEPELISFEDDGNVESVQVPNVDERLDEAEISVANVTNQQEIVNAASSMEIMADAVHSSASSLSSLDEVSEQIYNDKEGDEVATSVSETSYYFEEHGNSIERSETDVTSLSVDVSQTKEPVYDTSPRSVTRNLSSSSICNDLQADVSERGQSLPTSEGASSYTVIDTVPKVEMDGPGNDAEFIDSSEADDVRSRSITNDYLNELELNLGPAVVEDNLHKDESFQHTGDQHQSLSSADVVADMDASHSYQLEQVKVPSSSSNGRSHESTHQEEVISQPDEERSLSGRFVDRPLEEDPEELQVQEFKQREVTSSNSEAQFAEVVRGETYENPDPTRHQFVSEEEATSQPQKEFPLLDTSANEPSEDNPELQITSNNLDDSQIKELGNDISLSINSVLNAEPDVVEVVGIETEEPGNQVDPSEIHSFESNGVPYNIEDVDEINEIDETLLDNIEGVDEIDENFLVELDAVGDFSVNDLVSTSNEMEDDIHASDHVLETILSADEDSFPKDLGSALNEMEQPPHDLEHDLEAKHSGDEDLNSKDLRSTLNEIEEGPYASDHDLETKHSADEDSYSKDLGSEQHQHSLEHDLETKHSEDLGATLDEIKQDPHASQHDLETKLSGDEDSESKVSGSTLNEMKQDTDASEHDLKTKLSGDEDSESKVLGSTLNEMTQDPNDLETKLSGDEDSYSEAIGSTMNETTQDPQALGHGLETFYSVDEYAFSKIVESTLNEMKYEPQALEHVLETNPSADEDLYPTDLSKTELKMDEEEVLESQNEKESSNTEVAGASEAEVFKTKLIDDTNGVALPQETESNSTSAPMVNHGTENASSTSNTDKE